MRVKQESLYDSEATLRLVDRVLEELDGTHCLHPLAGLRGYRAEQLRDGTAELDQPSNAFLRVYWEIQETLECLRDGHEELRAAPADTARAATDERDRMSHALAMVDQLRSDRSDPRSGMVHEALRDDLLALADQLRYRESISSRLHRTMDLLCDLEVRLTQLSRIFDSGNGRMPM